MRTCETCGRTLTPNATALGWRWCWAFYCTFSTDRPEVKEIMADYNFFIEPIMRRIRLRK